MGHSLNQSINLSRRGVRFTSSGVTQIEPTDQAVAEAVTPGWLALMVTSSCPPELGVTTVMATRPPIQKASVNVLSMKRASSRLVSDASKLSTSDIPPLPTITLLGSDDAAGGGT
mmetsp:Transcript_33428/g.66530  ORF Transcript_33428/g.66530 Transcript_33428/m.66530 type:complete len:115 (-) Transcript_33428:40-384(-)